MFDKELWRSLIRFVSLDRFPVLICPDCHIDKLELDQNTFMYQILPLHALPAQQLDKAFAFSQKQIVETLEKDKFAGFLMGIGTVVEMLKFSPAKFICFFRCRACGSSTSAAGTAAVPKQLTHIGDIRLKVEYFSPAVPLFVLKDWVPNAIRDELVSAFSYFHSDLTASGAKIRRAVEQYCGELGYGDGTLHRRIQDMGKDYPIEAEWLLSLKLLGNEATHSSNIDETDLLHSFEIFEELLDIFRRKSRFKPVQEASVKLEQKFKKLQA